MTIPLYGVFDPDEYEIQLVSALTNAQLGNWYRGDASAGQFSINLPVIAVKGGPIIVENVGTANNILVNRTGGNDTIEGASQIAVPPGTYVELTSRVADTTWYRRGRTWEAIGGRDVRRDVSGRAQFSDPFSSADAATKNYVDTKRLTSIVQAYTTLVNVANSPIYATPATPYGANGLAVGDSFRFVLTLTNTANAQTTTFTVRGGTNGAATDAALLTLTLAAGTAAAGGGKLEVIASVRAIGASGTAQLTLFAQWLNQSNSGAGLSASTVLGTSVVSTSVDTTTALKLGVAVASTVANVVTVQNGILEIIRKA